MDSQRKHNRQVMGIVNCTPDSFFTGTGTMPAGEELLQMMDRQLSEGADLLDLGSYSTRPGADDISVEEEWARLQVGLEAAVEACRRGGVEPCLSVDTFRVEVARRAIERFPIAMINDVTGGQYDEAIYRLVAESGVRYVAMHMRGTPQTMQQLTRYENVAQDVAEWLEQRVERMVHLGVKPEQILLDPGFGFAKTLEQEYLLVEGLERIVALGYPVLVGVSRKSMLTRPLGIGKEEALPATTALHWELLRKGASILRVHDVAAARQTVELYNYYEKTALTR